MKKIFRMALVFALAGATLMYTGCTKDYSEDINKLDGEISSLEGKYQDLLNQLAEAKTTLAAAYTAADQKLAGDFDKKIAEINAAIAKKADAAAIEAEMDQLKKDLMAEADKLQKSADALKKEVQDLLDDFYAQVSGELRALVFVPDFYLAGVEATSYDFANIQAWKSEPIKEAQKIAKVRESDVSVLAGTKLDWARIQNAKKEYDKDYILGQIGKAKYDVNPSSFALDSADWKFNKNEVGYVVKADKKEWKPVFEGISYSEKGFAEALFSIENPELLKATVASAFEDGSEADAIVPLIQLEASLADDKTVSSDWAAVTTGNEFFWNLSFTVKSGYTTAANGWNKYDCDKANMEQHLYKGLPTALSNEPSVPVKFNGGPVDLAEFIEIHVGEKENGTGAWSRYTLEKLQEKYPGFELNFELVDYIVGAQKTSESAYGSLDGSMFTPCWVDGTGKSIEIAEDSEEGISAVGRRPVVLVTLTEPKGEVVLYGWFMIEITPMDVDFNAIELKDFGKLPLICNLKDSTTWYEFSGKVLEALKMDYKQFFNTAKIQLSDETFADLEQGESYDANVLVETFDKDGEFAGYGYAYELNKFGQPDLTKPLDFGTITYYVDSKGNTVNDKFVWAISPAAAKNINEYGSVYVIFQISEYQNIAFKFSAEIAEPAEITYGKINPAYWFEDIEAGVQNTVRANVIVPKTGDEDVKVFTKNIDDYFVGNKLSIQLKESADSIYKKYFDGKGNDDLETTYSYKFAAEQPVINGIPFVASANGTNLNIAQYDAVKKEYTKDEDGNYIAGDIIANIAGKEITYKNWKAAKELLNLWGKEETAIDSILYANIQVDYVAGNKEGCVVAADSSVFHIRFIRPLDIKSQATDGLADAIPGGDVIALGSLLNAIDWNDNEPDYLWSFVKKGALAANSNGRKHDAKTEGVPADGYYADTYLTAAGKEIVWFKYYGFQTIKVDAENVMTDQTGEWELLSKVNSAAKAYLAQLSGTSFVEVAGGTTGTLTAADTYPYQITGLTDYVFFYENNGGVVKNFNLKVPVEINYAWGTLKAEVVIPVSETYK